MEAFIARVAAETDIPVTRLAGVAPGGLNASGDSEQRDFEKAVNSRQEIELRPVLDRLDPFIAANVGQSGVPYFSFAPLSQLSETERWDIEKKRADTFMIYVNSGAFDVDDLAASARVAMAESDMWPGLEPEADEEEFVEPDADEVLGVPPVTPPAVGE
jgi:phage-related protein (TIGR01555 family)